MAIRMGTGKVVLRHVTVHGSHWVETRVAELTTVRVWDGRLVVDQTKVATKMGIVAESFGTQCTLGLESAVCMHRLVLLKPLLGGIVFMTDVTFKTHCGREIQKITKTEIQEKSQKREKILRQKILKTQGTQKNKKQHRKEPQDWKFLRFKAHNKEQQTTEQRRKNNKTKFYPKSLNLSLTRYFTPIS